MRHNVSEDVVQQARERVAVARALRVKLMTAHVALWQRVKLSVSQPRKTPRAQILVDVGTLLDLLDSAQLLADNHVDALADRANALESTRNALNAVRSHKTARAVAVDQFNQLSARYEALVRSQAEEK